MDLLLSTLSQILTPEGGWRPEFALRIFLSTALLFGYVVVLARTFGSRTFATFTSYDFLTNVAAGSLVASAILGKNLIEASLSLLCLVALQWAVSAWSARSERVQAAFDNGPVVLVEHGALRPEAMRGARVSRAILDQNLRAAGVPLAEVHLAVLESGGTISVIRAGG